jgi:predicted aminopeptidase
VSRRAARAPWRLALAGAALLALTGCAQLGYYLQSTSGHVALLRAARPVPEVLADPATPAPLRERLALSQSMRDFAVRELALPDNAAYRRYADLGRDAAVWNVVAAPEFSLELKRWCFLVVGCVGYRGHFDRADAEAAGRSLAAEGWETRVYGVPAYSSLGKLPGDFFADPLLNTFIGWDEVALARMIFHELSHQVAYADGDTPFNESYATAVERLGAQRWMARRGDPALRERDALAERRRAAFREMTSRTRERLKVIYASDLPVTIQRARKAIVMAEMRDEHAAAKAPGSGHPLEGDTGYDRWFATANNASFALLAAYTDQVDDFVRLFERQGRDFPRFHAEVRRLAALPAAERAQALAAP